MTIKRSASTITVLPGTDIAEQRMDLIKNHRALYSRKSITANTMIVPFKAKEIYSKPTYLTVQISDTEHIELWPEYLECVNHSCDPNAFFDTSTGQFMALKDIEIGEEFSFFYPSAEWDMDQPFQCTCGNINCLGVIRGAKYLTDDQVRNYRFTAFIKEKLTSSSR